MKKTAVIIALALGFSVSSLNATNDLNITESNETSLILPVVSPFCIAIAKGDIVTVKKLIELGSDVNQKSNGMTPLQYAAKFNRVEIIKILVSNGASLTKKSDKGLTAIKYAKQSNAKDAVTLLKMYSSKKKRNA